VLPGGHIVPVQVWGPDEITVDAVAAIDTMWGLTLAGRGAPWSLRVGLKGDNEVGTAFAGELGPLQAFEYVTQGGNDATRVDTTGGLPSTTGAPEAGVSTVQALLQGEPL
jgi:hypothetical protein